MTTLRTGAAGWMGTAGHLVLALLFVGVCLAGSGCKKKLPPVDRSCERDEDCTTDLHYIAFNGSCCQSCRYKVVNKRWAAKVAKICDKLGRKGCKMKKCKAPPAVLCLKGQCVTDPAPER